MYYVHAIYSILSNFDKGENIIKSLIYLSKNLKLKRLEMPDFIKNIQAKNAENEITGYLFEDSHYFLQYFEGKKEKVAELFSKLQKDSRHKILFFTSKPILKRRFENWSMNYFETTTAVEKMFLKLLIKQKKKAIKSIHPFYGFILKIFHKCKIWKIADQMHLVTRHTETKGQ